MSTKKVGDFDSPTFLKLIYFEDKVNSAIFS